MDNNILIDWAFSLRDSIEEHVKKNYREDYHRWPINHGFDAKGFSWNDKYLIVILYNKNLQVPVMGVVQNVDFKMPFYNPSLDNIGEIHHYLYGNIHLDQDDSLLIVPLTEGKNVTERFEKFNELEKNLWRKQISLNIQRQFYYIKGFEISGGFFLPPGYANLSEECKLFFEDYPNYAKNVFIMMKFDSENSLLINTLSELRLTLRNHRYTALRADDKMYMKDRDMWDNVCVYMLCCKQGTALLENYSRQEYNPNVAIEYGFMRALNKRVLLLRDKQFPRDRADVAGKKMLPFDINDKNSISLAVKIWLKEL
jgi:hypothetical protein